MRKTDIAFFNNQKIEIFVGKYKDGFELWQVGKLEHRVVLYHYLTHDVLEGRLEYAKAGDLVWRDAAREEIPEEKHKSAITREANIKEGKFLDSQNLIAHLDARIFLPIDRKVFNAAKKLILGKWTDGNITMSLEPDNKLQWSCLNPSDPSSLTNVGDRAPDWWKFALWQLHLWNVEQRRGTRASIFHVDEQELHCMSAGPCRIARIFRRC